MRKLLVGVLITMGLLMGCNSSDTSEDPITNGENGDVTEDSHATDNREGEALSIGDTGLMKSTIGEYEVTVKSVEFSKEYDGLEAREGESYLIFDLVITNTGETTIHGRDVTRASLFNKEGNRRENQTIREEIEPGETLEGKINFTHAESEYYNLIFGHGLSSVASELTWHFTPEEAK